MGNNIVKKAEQYLNVREIGYNRGPEVEMFQKSVGLKPGEPWCAAFVRYVLDKCHNIFVKVRSGLAMSYITKKSIKAKEVAKGYIKIKAGWLAIWRMGDTRKGHIGIVEKWGRNKGITIEGNTGPESGREGDGVYKKHRRIISWRYFRIIYFTPTY